MELEIRFHDLAPVCVLRKRLEARDGSLGGVEPSARFGESMHDVAFDEGPRVEEIVDVLCCEFGYERAPIRLSPDEASQHQLLKRSSNGWACDAVLLGQLDLAERRPGLNSPATTPARIALAAASMTEIARSGSRSRCRGGGSGVVIRDEL